MPKEIERRFLVNPDRLPQLSKGKIQTQGYLNQRKDDLEVRVRIEDKKAFLTLKSFVTYRTREEFEYAIPIKEAQRLLELTDKKVEKIRFNVKVDGRIWVVDFFENDNFPLIIAEVELKDELESFVKPLWLVKEVTQELRYSSMSLAFKPFNTWKRRNS